MTDTAYINAKQEQVFSFVFGQEPAKVQVNLSDLLIRLGEMDDSAASQILGSLGSQLSQFARVVDRNHPDLLEFRDGILCGNSTITKRLCQVIDAWTCAQQRGWDELLPLYKKISRQGLPSALTTIRSPEADQQNVRFVADAKIRGIIRATKQPRVIQLLPFFKRGESAWHIQPSDFDLFIPGSMAYEKQIAVAKAKAERFQKLGCEAMAKAVTDSITEFLSVFEKQKYRGFYRITATNAAVILAKIHGYTLRPSSSARSNDARMVRVPDEYVQYFKASDGKSIVGGGDDPESILIAEMERMMQAVAARDGSKMIPIEANPPASLVYSPTVYPLCHFLKTVYGGNSPKLRQYPYSQTKENLDVFRLIEYLEEYPPLNGKPIFDHFLVLVPTPQPYFWDAKQAAKNKGVRFSVSVDGGSKEFVDSLTAKLYLDAALVLSGVVTPVLLGERDGQCYFLSFWC